MEKISALIDKLQELKNARANLQTISYYTQLLQAEILHLRNLQKREEAKSHAHIAVIMPGGAPIAEQSRIETFFQQEPAPVKESSQAASSVAEKQASPVAEKQETPAHAVSPVAAMHETVANVVKQATNGAAKQEESAEVTRQTTNGATKQESAEIINGVTKQEESAIPHAHAAYIPTPEKSESAKNGASAGNPINMYKTQMSRDAYTATEAHHIPTPKQPQETNGIRKELNELVGKHATSLNDTLRNGKAVEVGEKLGGMGIKDLKSAIGINDQFQFIQDLFRSDKVMYDRSVKTINESASLQEAEYWIERELKIKLGWNEQEPLVQHFLNIVKKRFS